MHYPSSPSSTRSSSGLTSSSRLNSRSRSFGKLHAECSELHTECTDPATRSRVAFEKLSATRPRGATAYVASCTAVYRLSDLNSGIHSINTSLYVFLSCFPRLWTNSYCFRVGLRYEPGHWSRTIDTFLLIEDNSTSLTLLDAVYPGRVTITFFLIHAISPLSAPQHFPLTAI